MFQLYVTGMVLALGLVLGERPVLNYQRRFRNVVIVQLCWPLIALALAVWVVGQRLNITLNR